MVYKELPYNNHSAISLQNYSYLSLPFENGSIGGYWTEDGSINNICLSSQQPGQILWDSLPSPLFSVPRKQCFLNSREDTTVDSLFYVPIEPVGSLYFSSSDSDDLDFNDFILRGSILETAYTFADTYWDDGQIQSLIVDTGSSLTTFPCEHVNENQLNQEGIEHELRVPEELRADSFFNHMDPTFQKSSTLRSFGLPCSLSCRNCMVNLGSLWKWTLRKNRSNMFDNWCDPSEVDIAGAQFNPNGVFPFYNFSNRNSISHSANAGMAYLNTFADTWFNMLEDWQFPINDGFIPRFSSYPLRGHTQKSGTDLFNEMRYLLISQSRMFYRSHDEASQIFLHWLNSRPDFFRGSDGDFLFMSQQQLQYWNEGPWITSINIESDGQQEKQSDTDSKENLFCSSNAHGKRKLSLSVTNPPLLDDHSVCAFEVSYLEGSTLRGSVGVSKLEITELGLKDVEPRSPIKIDIGHGCTSLETHLFLEQKANGILGLEPWPYYPFETFFGNMMRPAQKRSSCSICYSGRGGIMRFGNPLKEYWSLPIETNSNDQSSTLKNLLFFDRMQAIPAAKFLELPLTEQPLFVRGHNIGQDFEKNIGEALNLERFDDTEIILPTTPLVRRVRRIENTQTRQEELILRSNRVSYTVGMIGITLHPPKLIRKIFREGDGSPHYILPNPSTTYIDQYISGLDFQGDKWLEQVIPSTFTETDKQYILDSGSDLNMHDPPMVYPTLIDSGTTMSHMPGAVVDRIAKVIDSSIQIWNDIGTKKKRSLAEAIEGNSVGRQFNFMPIMSSLSHARPQIDLTQIDDEMIKENKGAASTMESPEVNDTNKVLHLNEKKVEDNTPIILDDMKNRRLDESVDGWGSRVELVEFVRADILSNLKIHDARPLFKRHLDPSEDVPNISESNKGSNDKCWILPRGRKDLEIFPTIEIRFMGGVVREWHPEEYLFVKHSEYYRCLTIKESIDNRFQLGLSFFQDVDITFNAFWDEKKLSPNQEMMDPDYMRRTGLLADLRDDLMMTGPISKDSSGFKVPLNMSITPAICPRYGMNRELSN